MSEWEGDEEENGEEAEFEAEAEVEEQLELADDDEPLPWLESDDEYEEEGFDSRLIVLALIGLVAIVAVVFAIWSFTRSGDDSDVVADGSTIEAPDEPYRERPDDPGGTEVEGTGDVSFRVGQGEGSEGQVADGAPAPSIDREQDGEAAASAGVGVQVGAYSSRATARDGWNVLRSRFEALQGLNYRIVEAEVDGNTIYRLQAVAADGAAADGVCRSIRAAGGDCQVKR